LEVSPPLSNKKVPTKATMKIVVEYFNMLSTGENNKLKMRTKIGKEI
jgi:hypothetical protein